MVRSLPTGLPTKAVVGLGRGNGDAGNRDNCGSRGVDWRNFVSGGTSSGDQSTIEFSDGRRACVAVERLGPRWRGGFVWVIHATICEAGALPLGPADIDTVFNSLQPRIYDPEGNLRAAG